ncbi:MAG: CRISPR-associated endonuclease Cas3'' [Bacteroides sp.]|nr:CRISPR-associated endonuclease Cas3'' [Bacteroides sp.]MBD5375546.1 CRISPR-associated endonuclease Cas3'' [Bacteroides sp.]
MTHTTDPIIAHLLFKENQWLIQTNEDHSSGVATLASHFAESFGMSGWARLAGLLHDRGKEKEDFQRYIRITSGYDLSAGRYSDKTHSMIGAAILHRFGREKSMVLANIVGGHHRGLYNLDELEKMLTETIVPEQINHSLPTVSLESPPKTLRCQELHHLTRMLFSCLVDADWLDTERFMQPDIALMRGKHDTLATLSEKLDRYCQRFESVPDTPINRLRTRIQTLCREASHFAPGFFDLTVPTGGGKTIASVIWAVNHALAHGKERIIIAIPFTSIIVQTARILRDIFGEANVVEHHSVVDEETAGENQHTRLACENWDAPIIVTTNVQLFESMFSNRPGKCRKLHSLCRSVVILDEAQSLPLTFLQPIVDAMATYVRHFSLSFLFCTASQPVLDGMRKGEGAAYFNGIDPRQIRHIIPGSELLHHKLRRVNINMPRERISIESLAGALSCHDRVLCIVNTRPIAAEIFSHLPPDNNNIHLSRTMCSAHIACVIGEIRQRLAESDRPVRVISTQLIEAGVDIDFPVVYRQLAGLDSILQAAGRCNREGRLQQLGTTHVFDLENTPPACHCKSSVYALRDMLTANPESDWFAPEVMTEFYTKLYSKTRSFDIAGIAGLVASPTEIGYESISDGFRLIDDHGKAVIVNYGAAPELIEQLRQYGPSLSLTRKLALYTVSVSQHQFKEFDRAGLIDRPCEGFFYIPLRDQYDDSIGLKVNNEYLEQSFIL